MKILIKLKKSISILTAFCLLISFVIGPTAANAMTNEQATKEYKQIFKDFMLPYSYGQITSAHFAGTDRVIINIQDLHCHQKVQKNIANIIETFDKSYGVKKVYLEGAYGQVSTKWLTENMDKTETMELLNKMIETGRLTGAEYYSAVSGKTNIINGLEEKGPYLENLKRFGEIIENQKQINLILQAIDKEVCKVKEKYYTKRQYKIEELSKKYKAGEISPQKYYVLLLKHVDRLGIDISKYENTFAYIMLLDLQKTLNYNAITTELQNLVLLLNESLSYNAYQMLVDSTDNFSKLDKLYGYIIKISRNLNLDLSVNFAELDKYFRYIEMSQKINPLDLISEEEKITQEININFSETKAQREVVFLSNFNKYLRDYVTSKITSDDYKYYKNNIETYKKLWNKYVDNKVLSLLDEYLVEADKFYDINNDRNIYFTNNMFHKDDKLNKIEGKEEGRDDVNKIIANMKEMKEVDVVITGGFHSQTVTEILKNQGVNYIVITPNVTDGVKLAEETYYQIAREQSQIGFQTIANLIASLSPQSRQMIFDLLNNKDLSLEMRDDMTNEEQIAVLIKKLQYAQVLDSDFVGNIEQNVADVLKEIVGEEYKDKITPELIMKMRLTGLEDLSRIEKTIDLLNKTSVAGQALFVVSDLFSRMQDLITIMPIANKGSQLDIATRVARANPQRIGFIKDVPILGYVITSDRFEDIPEVIREKLGAVDRTKYTQEYLRQNIGNIIALQMKSDGTADFYIVGNYKEKYRPVSKEEVRQKNAKLMGKLLGIEGIEDLIAQDENIVGALKTAPVEMIKMSDLGYAIDEEVTIESPWGEQTKPAGQEAYLVFDANKNQYYMVNIDEQTGLPISYVPTGKLVLPGVNRFANKLANMLGVGVVGRGVIGSVLAGIVEFVPMMFTNSAENFVRMHYNKEIRDVVDVSKDSRVRTTKILKGIFYVTTIASIALAVLTPIGYLMPVIMGILSGILPHQIYDLSKDRQIAQALKEGDIQRAEQIDDSKLDSFEYDHPDIVGWDKNGNPIHGIYDSQTDSYYSQEAYDSLIESRKNAIKQMNNRKAANLKESYKLLKKLTPLLEEMLQNPEGDLAKRVKKECPSIKINSKKQEIVIASSRSHTLFRMKKIATGYSLIQDYYEYEWGWEEQAYYDGEHNIVAIIKEDLKDYDDMDLGFSRTKKFFDTLIKIEKEVNTQKKQQQKQAREERKAEQKKKAEQQQKQVREERKAEQQRQEEQTKTDISTANLSSQELISYLMDLVNKLQKGEKRAVQDELQKIQNRCNFEEVYVGDNKIGFLVWHDSAMKGYRSEDTIYITAQGLKYHLYQIVPNGWGDGMDAENHEFVFTDSQGVIKKDVSSAWMAREFFNAFSNILTDSQKTKFSQKALDEQKEKDKESDYYRDLRDSRNYYLKTASVNRLSNTIANILGLGEIG